MENFKSFLEVKNPPWEGLGYLESQARVLRAIEEKLQDFQDNWKVAEDLVKNFYGSRNPWYEIDIYDVPYWLKNLAIGDLNSPSWSSKSTYSVRIQSSVDYLPKFSGDYYRQTQELEHIVQSVKETKQEFYKKNNKFFQYYREIKNKLPEVLDTFKDQKKYFKGEKNEDEDYPTYEEANKSVIKSVEHLDGFIKYASIVFDIKEKVESWIERRNIAYQQQFNKRNADGSLMMPKHKPKEILHHATVAISAIQRDGLKSKKQAGVEGLGGGSSELVSFTSSFKLAREIAAAIKEMVLISKGQIKYEDIMKWVVRDGLDLEKLEYNVRMYASKNDGPEDKTINLYKNYLQMSSQKGLRYNPVFWSATADKYKNININDIGVISAIVDMSKVEDFMGAEEEFRVPPSAMIKIFRVTRV